MARITLRLEDEVHDRLILRALRSHRTVSDLIRPAVNRIADPGGDWGPNPEDAHIAMVACLVSLMLLELEVRSPELIEKGASRARALMRRWGMPDDVCDLAVAEMENLHAR